MTNVSIAVRVFVAAALLWPASLSAQEQAATPARGQQRGRVPIAERAKMPAPQGFSVVLVLGEMQGTGAAENVPPAARKALIDMKDFLPYKSYRLLDAQWTLCCGRTMIAARLRGPEQQDYDLELDPGPSETSGKWNVRFALREAAAAVVANRTDTPFADQRTAALTAQRAELETKIRQLKERYDDNHPDVRAARAQLDALAREQQMIRNEESMKRLRTAQGSLHRRAIIDTSFTMDIGETVVVGTSRLQGDKALIALLTAAASTKAATK
jgi:hypothetical protein